MIALTFALLFLTFFLFGRGYWQHIALPKLQNQRLQLQLVRVKRQGQYLKLWLQHPDGLLLPKAKAGQHILLYGKDLQGKPVSRAYSLAQDCSQQRYYQLVIKAETDGRLSQALFPAVKSGGFGRKLLSTWAFFIKPLAPAFGIGGRWCWHYALCWRWLMPLSGKNVRCFWCIRPVAWKI